MKLIDVLRKECVVAGGRFRDKAEALCGIVQIAKENQILKDVSENEILSALQERESLGSTGFGKEIAIPHCRMKSVTDFVVGLISVPDGVDFDALDEKKVKLIIFIIAPEVESNKHLKLLSAISQTLLIPDVVNEIMAETAPEALYESFLRHTRADIEPQEQTAKVMFNIFVHDENIFHEILEKVTGVETSSIVVADSENIAAYLTKVPLFADFWRDKPSSFSKVIIAVTQKALTNETIRRIETVTGSLAKCTGVMVTVQNLAFVSGTL